jgi:hypothetical protein
MAVLSRRTGVLITAFAHPLAALGIALLAGLPAQAETRASKVFATRLEPLETIYADQDAGRVGQPVPAATMTGGAALAFLYGNYDADTQRAKWTLSPAVVARLHQEDCLDRAKRRDCDLSAEVRVVAEKLLGEAGERYLLLTAAATPAASKGFAVASSYPFVGGAIFERRDGGWTLLSEAKMLAFVRLGKGAPQFVAIGPRHFGVVLTHEWDREFTRGDGRVVIVETGDRLAPALLLGYTGFGIAGRCGEKLSLPCSAYASDLSFQPGTDPEYLDLVRQTRGTVLDFAVSPPHRPDDRKEVTYDVEETVTYRFIDGAYR